MGHTIVQNVKKEGSSNMKKIALTGGIGSGKSTVANVFQQHNIPVIDADRVVHTLYQEAEVVDQLTKMFGNDINESGVINRKRLGALIFHDQQAKQRLDHFFRDRITEEVTRLFQTYEEQGYTTVVYDAALIYEWGIESEFDLVIVVDAPLHDRIARICMRDHLTENDAMARIKSQMPLSEKVLRADIVIENNTTIEQLEKQIEIVMKRIISSALFKEENLI